MRRGGCSALVADYVGARGAPGGDAPRAWGLPPAPWTSPAPPRPATLGVVGVPGGHQQRAQVGVADAELAVGAGGLADLLRREVGEADRDVHRGDDQLRDLREPRGVEGVVVAEELEQVDAG